MSGFFPTSYLIYFFLLELIELFPLPRPISSEFNSVKNEKRYEPLVEEITPSLPRGKLFYQTNDLWILEWTEEEIYLTVSPRCFWHSSVLSRGK